MKAAIFREVGAPLSIEEISISKPGPREVLVRTAAAGVCHSDLHFIEGLYPAVTPMVLGHESAGVVEAVGGAVTHVRPGDHVVCSWNPHCGDCFYCDRDQPILCETFSATQPKGLTAARSQERQSTASTSSERSKGSKQRLEAKPSM